MKAAGLVFAVLIVYAILQLIFDSIWVLVGLLVVQAFMLGFYLGIRSAAINIIEGRVKLP